MYFPTSFADDLKKKTFKKLELFERNVYQNPKPSKLKLRFHVLGNLQHRYDKVNRWNIFKPLPGLVKIDSKAFHSNTKKLVS